ncbi:MAG TPA: hypothetical protein VN919_05810 [Xanthobacteraceae bacterium]|nr:hypothetical protein [Xanthobacteraceae bacterium]
MRTLIAILREVAGLFVDDGSLALAILAVVGIAAFLAIILKASALAVGLVLLGGCVAVLIENIMRTVRRN